MRSLIFFGLAIASFAGTASAENCWEDAFSRGVGKVISACQDGYEKNGALCYPLCKEGFTGVGPVCWRTCPEGFRDDGAFCYKPASYGRGAGYPSWQEGKCLQENPQGCEKDGALWYPKCKAGFHAAGCCVCSPNCPLNTTDIGISCEKHSYGRGAGVPMGCPKGQVIDAGLCYPPCADGYRGVGPVCWQSCPAGKYACGALCMDEPGKCTDFILGITDNLLKAAITIAVNIIFGGQIDIMELIKTLGGAALALANKVCDHPPRPINHFEVALH